MTIEAKSPQAGTISAIHVEVGQNVEVGQPFFTLSLSGDAPPPPAAPTAAAEPTAAAPSTAAAAEPSSQVSARIHPSGKRSLISFPKRGPGGAAARNLAAAKAPSAPTAAKPAKPPPAGTIAYGDLPLRFRMPEISEEEMDCIDNGGAGHTF